MTFPTVSGSNLLRQKLTLPPDFRGRLNLVFIAFERWHQMEVDSWTALAAELGEQYEDLVYYELPTLQGSNSFYKVNSLTSSPASGTIPITALPGWIHRPAFLEEFPFALFEDSSRSFNLNAWMN